VRAFPGTAELLKGLKSSGTRIAAATSKNSKVARENLNTAGLLASVDAVRGSDHVQNYQPHP
jgi:phosphoglycolate phosphatase-like HAD superfamily hydrolase